MEKALGFENGLHRYYLKESQAKENKATSKRVEGNTNTRKPKKQSLKETSEYLEDLTSRWSTTNI